MSRPFITPEAEHPPGLRGRALSRLGSHFRHEKSDPSDPLKAEVSKNAAAACNQCHKDNAKKDWVFSRSSRTIKTS